VSVFLFIEAEKAQQRNVAKACALLEVSRSAFYDWHQHLPSARQVADDELAERIEEIWNTSRGTYGWPRVHRQLRRDKIHVGGKRVARIMRQRGLIGRCRRRWTKTTIADPEATAVDLLKRAFGPGTVEVDRVYVGDITYIWTWEGWAYLATVIDLASRRVVGWALADHMRAELVCDALRMAIAHRRPAPGLIFHSDRGTQGGFNWSSQHLDRGGVVDDDAGASAGGAVVSGSDPVAGSADGGVAAGSCAVLVGDRARREVRGCGGRDRCVIRGRDTMVPSRWRREPEPGPDGVGPLPVLRRAGGHRHLARAEGGCARDRPAAAAVAIDDLA
jgi:putative transposase